MYKHILVAVSMEEGRDIARAVKIARTLRASDGKITALHVIEETSPSVLPHLPRDFLETQRVELSETLKKATGNAEDVNHALISGHSATTILEYARGHEVDCIVIASHRPGIQDYFLGSTAARVVRHAPCSVHVMR